MREIVVQKFGGTSVATLAAREHVVRHIERALAEGSRPVVVVSAMGRRGDPYATDTLIDLIEAVGGHPERRDLDLLLACGEVISTVVLSQTLRERGHNALAFTGAQAGVVTDDNHGNARILRVEPERILGAVADGAIPVIAGFQGRGPSGETTTLGRGGSDTTAAALAVALGASLLEVFTDVEGVKTADPRLAPDAATLEQVTYREVAEMAHLGAKVIHPRAVEIAMIGQVPVKVRPTESDAPGTLVCDGGPQEGLERSAADKAVTGIAHVSDRVQVLITPKEGEDDAAVRLFDRLGQALISVDMIYVSPDRIAFIAEGKEGPRIEGILQYEGFDYQLRSEVAKVSAVGAGMHGVPGVMARVTSALADTDIPILQTTDSHANISCLVPEARVRDAVLALHQEFELAGTASVKMT